jgi:hypothetical protein
LGDLALLLPWMFVIEDGASNGNAEESFYKNAAACSGRIRNSKDSDSAVEKYCIYNGIDG